MSAAFGLPNWQSHPVCAWLPCSSLPHFKANNSWPPSGLLSPQVPAQQYPDPVLPQLCDMWNLTVFVWPTSTSTSYELMSWFQAVAEIWYYSRFGAALNPTLRYVLRDMGSTYQLSMVHYDSWYWKPVYPGGMLQLLGSQMMISRFVPAPHLFMKYQLGSCALTSKFLYFPRASLHALNSLTNVPCAIGSGIRL